MKRGSSIILFVCVLVTVLAAAMPAGASEEGKLLIWADEVRATVMTEFAAGFEAKYKMKITVQQTNFKDIKEQLGTAGPAGSGPDIIVGQHDWLGEFVTSGLIEPIDLGDKQKDFSPSSLQAFTWGKSLYGLPYGIESVGLIYNKALVPKPPKTWTELVSRGRKLSNKAKGQWGFTMPQPDPYHTFPLMSATGAYVFGVNADGTLNPLDVGLNNKGGVFGLQLLVDLVKAGIMPLGCDYDTMINLFKTGKVAMIIAGPWTFADFRAAKVNFGFTKLPTVKGKIMRPFVGVAGFMVSAHGKNKMLAKTFLTEFVATKSAMKSLFNKDPRPPAYLPVAKEVTDPDISGVLANAATGIPMPAIPEMGSVWNAWSNAISLALNGQLTPQKALDDAVDQIVAAIKRGM